jgi:hypothetical protein
MASSPKDEPQGPAPERPKDEPQGSAPERPEELAHRTPPSAVLKSIPLALIDVDEQARQRRIDPDAVVGDVVGYIDRELGEGYASAHPSLVAAMAQSAAIDACADAL